jgi:hypothetical protein
MNPMSTFDPDMPCRVHGALNDKAITWQTYWASNWRQYARIDRATGVVYFDGRILDGWEPMGVPD